MRALDERLTQAFATVELPQDFDVRLQARVRALQVDEAARLRAARADEQSSYAAAGRRLERWRGTALRMFSLDAIAGGTLLILLSVALPRLTGPLGVYGPSFVIAALLLAVTGYAAASVLKSSR